MNANALEKLSRNIVIDNKSILVMKPGIAVVIYSDECLSLLMQSTAKALQKYLSFIPNHSIKFQYEPGIDEYSSGKWINFDVDSILSKLNSGKYTEDDNGFGFVLGSTVDGQAGNYAVIFGGVDVDGDEYEETELSMLRFEFPSFSSKISDYSDFLDFISDLLSDYPFCSGYAGYSFNHTISYAYEVRSLIYKLAPRYLGLDLAYSSSMLEMRSKSPGASWLNFLSNELVINLGGKDQVSVQLKGCQLVWLDNGLIIRSAKFPQIVDVNRSGGDVGLLPIVSNCIKPIRFNEASFIGLADEISGQEWIERFDSINSGTWNNG